jgi:hypothetical protein
VVFESNAGTSWKACSFSLSLSVALKVLGLSVAFSLYLPPTLLCCAPSICPALAFPLGLSVGVRPAAAALTVRCNFRNFLANCV